MADPATLRYRAWCFTINNYDTMDVWEVEQLAAWEHTAYTIVGKEVGDAAATPHLQGYVEFSKGIPLTRIKGFLTRAHLERRRGTSKQAAEYCKKEGDWKEVGTISKVRRQGPSALAASEAKDLMDSGGTLRDVAELNYGDFCVHHSAHAKYLAMVQPVRSLEPGRMDIRVYWGATGLRKSTRAFFEFPAAYVKDPRTRWWDGYTGQDTVVVDEFYGGISWSLLLRMTERFPCPIETKGGTVQLQAHRFIFTSNADPRTWYEANAHRHIETWMRRITSEVHFTDVWEEPEAVTESDTE